MGREKEARLGATKYGGPPGPPPPWCSDCSAALQATPGAGCWAGLGTRAGVGSGGWTGWIDLVSDGRQF
jgi:hypothetical protein